MRRNSLLDEIRDKDQSYAGSRVSAVLDSLAETERREVLSELERKKRQNPTEFKDKNPFNIARIIDSFFERKDRQKQSGGGPSRPPPAIPKPLQGMAPPAPLSGIRKSVIASISAPTPIAEHLISESMVGDYRFIKTLGKGTFGKVKLAEHTHSKQLAAIKIIEKSNIKTTKQKISVDREVRLMKLLHHPHIVGVIDVFESTEYIFIVMEHAAGGELFDYIVKNGMVKEPEAKKFFRQILSAVEYCHQNSVIHRDLKPENLLLDDYGNIKIIDFGFGNTFHRDRLLDTYCGSPFYAAPEMIQGIRYIGPEVDVWSLGVILYALLSGRLPFDATSMNELYEKIAKGKYTCPAHFSPGAINLISIMLKTDPKKRATLEKIRSHPWVTENSIVPVESYVPSRETIVSQPQCDSLMELVSYGFRKDEVERTLRSETALHPIVSLYHLIEEARRRKDAFTYLQHPTQPERPASTPIENDVMNNSLAQREELMLSASAPSPSKSSGGNGNAFINPWNRLTRNRKSATDTGETGVEDTNSHLSQYLYTGKDGSNIRSKRRSSNPTYPTQPAVDYSDYPSAHHYQGNHPGYLQPPHLQQQPVPDASVVRGEISQPAAIDPRKLTPLRPSPAAPAALVSNKKARDICTEIERVLKQCNISFAKASDLLYSCDENGCRFTVEIVGRHDQMHEIKFRRIQSFWNWNHRAVFGRISKDLQL